PKPFASESSLGPLARRCVGLRLLDCLGSRDDLHDPPRLALRDRAALADRDGVADARRVLLVVSHDLRRAANVLPVDRVPDQPLDRDRDALVHLVTDDPTDDFSARLAAVRRRLLGAFRRAHHFVPFSLFRSPSTVLILAMSLRTLPC